MKALSLATILIAAFVVSAMLDQESGLEIWRELRRDLAVADERVERLIRENAALRSEIETLESEPDALERAIREELDLAMPGEIVVRFEPTGQPPVAPSPVAGALP